MSATHTFQNCQFVRPNGVVICDCFETILSVNPIYEQVDFHSNVPFDMVYQDTIFEGHFLTCTIGAFIGVIGYIQGGDVSRYGPVAIYRIDLRPGGRWYRYEFTSDPRKLINITFEQMREFVSEQTRIRVSSQTPNLPEPEQPRPRRRITW